VLLERLEIYGFKSFAQRTTLRFAPGITAIVGPNGCGKSNISDAIRWALGEQNVRNLRGKQLIDVIFKGTREAKPLGMAEVTLHLDNREQRLSTEYAEVAIQRRTFRSGESDFRINKAPCRLRDIRDMFMDTGLGSSEYAVIEREMIDEVLADRDQSRRFLMDEAAGITRYKQRRKETLQKLEAVEADLVRVEDALEIEEREVRSLAYQMGKARRYQRLTERIRAFDVSLARLRWRELVADASGESGRLGEEERTREQLLTEVHRADAEQETLRVELLDLGRRITHAQQRLSATEAELAALREEGVGRRERVHALEERIVDLTHRVAEREAARTQAREASLQLEPEAARLEANLAERQAVAAAAEEAWSTADRTLRAVREELAREQQLQLEQVKLRSASDHRLESLGERVAQLGEQAERLVQQRETLGGRATEIAGDLERIQARIAQGNSELEGAQTLRTGLEGQREGHSVELAQLGEQIMRLAADEARHESRLHLLDEQSRSFEGYREGVARLLASRDAVPGVLGVAAELMTIAPKWRERLSPALRELTEWIVTETEAAAWQAIAWLRAQGLGQVTFFPLAEQPSRNHPSSSGDAAGLPADALSARDAAVEPLAAYVRAMVRPVVERGAVPPVHERKAGQLWVTEGGEVFAAAGWVCGGGKDSAEGYLWERPEEIARLRASLAERARTRAERQARERGLRNEIARLDGTLAQLDRECQERHTALDNLGHARVEREAELRLVGGEMGRLAEEEQRLRGQQAALEREMTGSREQQAAVAAVADSADERLRAAAARVEAAGSEKDRQGKTLTEKKMEALWAETQLRDARGLLAQHVTEALECERQIARMAAEREEAGAEITAATARIEDLGGLEAERLRSKESQTRETDRLGEERMRLESRLSEIEQELRTRRRSLSEIETLLRENEVRLARVESEKERLGERIREQYGVELAALEDAAPETPGAEPAPDVVLGDLTPEAARERLEEVRLERDRLGPVNVLAIEEHERKREHVRFIREQRDDLVKSKEQLLAAIDRINTEARRLFEETFGQVQANFARTFATLFPGGEAQIQLTGDDPLEAEIDIVARPRGKRFESIRLLSSGERALTATALLFAVYLVRPSPFCVLDEVDAPLDDANIERFVNMLRAFSDRTQFIVITHNKLTMETSDALYGVTMQEPGISRVVSVRLDGGRLVSEDHAAGRGLTEFVVR
jgi:chromosome segregation protein